MDSTKRTRGRPHDPANPAPAGLAQPAAAEPACDQRPRRPLPSPDELLAAARQARQQHTGPMTLDEFECLTGFKSFHVTQQFAGGWTELRERAGIPLHPRERNRWSHDELLAEFHRVAVQLSRIPRWVDVDRLARVSAHPFQHRFGNKAELSRRYRAWLETHDPASPLLPQLDAGGRRTGAPHRRRARRGGRRTEPPWPQRRLDAAPIYGEELNFRALAHAPTNEQGVILLFGMLADELGYRIQAIGPAFPDCHAKRALDPARTHWQPVRIEFEHRSHNFRDHNHDPAACDLIICWLHDWPDCPLEVLELSQLTLAMNAVTTGPAPVGP